MTAQQLSTSASCRTNSSFPPPAFASSASLAEGPGLAHDAGNLLSALGLYCDLLHRPGVLRAEHRHYADELQSLSERSGSLIRRLLNESGRPQQNNLRYNSCDAATVMRPLTPLLRALAAPHARLVVSIATHLPMFPCPAETLERITVNLVRNAAQALGDAETMHGLDSPGTITVRFTTNGSELALEVEDNGPGMPPAVAAAFLRPAPLPPGARRGLGHRIVHELATASAGRPSVRVRPGRGTAIRIAWPMTIATAQEGTGRTC